MKTYNVIIGLLVFSNICFAQNNSCIREYDPILKRVVYTYVDKMPEYPDDLANFLVHNYRMGWYSTVDFHGHIFLQFVVDTDGSIVGERVMNKNLKDITPMENEGLRVLRMMKKWIPGECKGKKVPVKDSLPITF